MKKVHKTNFQKSTQDKFTVISPVLSSNNKNLGQLQALGQDDKNF